MKRITDITGEQQAVTDDSVNSDELDYLQQNEKSLLDDRQYFSWNAPTTATDDSLLPALELDGIFDDKGSISSANKDQQSLGDLDLLGIFDDLKISPSPDPDLLSELDCSIDEENEPEEIEPSLDDDKFYTFASEYDREESSLAIEDEEPDWLDLAGDADEFDDSVSTTFDAIEVEGTIERAERALQAAMDVGFFFDLDESEIHIVASIFEENGWSACRTAIVRELENNTSVNELELASVVKQMWLDHYEFYSSAVSNYRILSWPTALKLVNSFAGYPSIEEIEQLLGYLHTHWRGNKIQRLISRSFNEYLIGYLGRVVDGFEFAPEWAIGQESPCSDYYVLPPCTEDIPAIHDFELEKALRNVRRNNAWLMNEGLYQ